MPSWKTDRVSNGNQLVERYAIQLRLYRQALEQLTGKRVKDTYIYSFRLGDFFSVE